MKARFITHYTMIHSEDPGAEFWGTCKKWYEDSLFFGLELVKEEKVLWIGKQPICHLCIFGGHVKPETMRKGRA